MTDEKDPGLQALFEAAPVASQSDAFAEHVMAGIDRQRRRTVLGWALTGLALAPVTWWLSGPVVTTISLASRLMPDSIFEIESAWLDQLLAPVNSGAGVAGLLFIIAWWLFRKIRS